MTLTLDAILCSDCIDPAKTLAIGHALVRE